MSTRELRCRFDHEEEGAPVCGECRRCCDALKARVTGLESRIIEVARLAVEEREVHKARAVELEADVNNVWAVMEDVVAKSARAFPDDRTKWIALRLRNLAKELEDQKRRRPRPSS